MQTPPLVYNQKAAQQLSASVLQEDANLVMYYDNALMRTED